MQYQDSHSETQENEIIQRSQKSQNTTDQDQQNNEQICSRSLSPTQKDQPFKDLKIQQQNLKGFELNVLLQRLQRDALAQAIIYAEEAKQKQNQFDKLILKLHENNLTKDNITELELQYQSLVKNNNFKKNDQSLELSHGYSISSKYSEIQSDTRWNITDIELILSFIDMHSTLELSQDNNLKELYSSFMKNNKQTRTDRAIKAKLCEIIGSIWTFDQTFKLKQWVLNSATQHIVTTQIANELQIDKSPDQIVYMLQHLKLRFIGQGYIAFFRLA
ncbi:Hypothetical_protein [Hexamita inflata]|uniref:Hypothetical_protein n=1 Tax=Hexamita inflata TaxID=28002 RepID=A0AA86PSA8_9EUKA|nr:Hypothetical protein HINF_LOCUS31481 [Hexamita inflata]